MTSSEIKIFIKVIRYDLDTIRYLIDYGRDKDSIIIMKRALDNIFSFRARMANDDNTLKNVFSDEFWKSKSNDKIPFEEIRNNINKFSQNTDTVTDQDLKRIGYSDFMEKVDEWVFQNVSFLKYTMKHPIQKKMEKIFLYLVVVAGVSLIIGFFLQKFFTKDTVVGLKGEFYQGENFEKEIGLNISKTINFVGYFDSNNELPQEHFSVRWSGFIKVPKSNQYTIYINVDGGVRLSIDGHLLINEQQGQAREVNKKIFLSKGKHEISLEYFQSTGLCLLRLLWQPEGGKKEIIPSNQFISEDILHKQLSIVFPVAEKSEPIVVSGFTDAGDFIYVRYLPGNNIIIGHDHWGVPCEETSSIHVDQNQQYKLEVIIDLRNDFMEIWMNEKSLFGHGFSIHPTSSSRITIGKNRIGGSSCGERFSGKISAVNMAAIE